MKVNNTIFNEIKASFVNLQKVLSDKYENVSVLIEKTNGKNYRLSKSGTLIKDNMFANCGAVIRLNSTIGLYEYSFNDFSPQFIQSIPSVIAAALDKYSDNDFLNAQMTDGSLLSSKEFISFNKSTDYEINPEDLNDNEITDSLEKIYNKAINYDNKITDCICIYQYLCIHKMFISDYRDLEQHIMWSNGVIEPMASLNGKTQYYLQTFSTLGGAELISSMNIDVDYSCKCAIELLDSTPPVAGVYDVICLPDVTGLIAHEAFGHGVEMDMFVKNRALAKNYIGRPIASPLVTMHDNAATCMESGTYFFDDEGTISNDTIIIEKGILKSGINDLQSADFLNVTPTGNGRRESYERKAYTRMTNTYFEAGSDRLEDMIASVDYGILLENGSSGMEDPKNWGIQCMVNIGREIKNGKLTGKIFSPLCLSGYVPDLLNSISMVSDDLHLSGCGYCGKGYKEWVKVSDGGPAIKAKVAIS